MKTSLITRCTISPLCLGSLLKKDDNDLSIEPVSVIYVLLSPIGRSTISVPAFIFIEKVGSAWDAPERGSSAGEHH
jgi:hypothetical protein